MAITLVCILNVPTQAHVLKAYSPAYGAMGRWGNIAKPMGRKEDHCGHILEGAIGTPAPSSFSLCFLVAMRWMVPFTMHCSHNILCYQCTSNGANHTWTETSKTNSQIFILFRFINSEYFVIVTKNWLIQTFSTFMYKKCHCHIKLNAYFCAANLSMTTSVQSWIS
jgi:hypothetical protein